MGNRVAASLFPDMSVDSIGENTVLPRSKIFVADMAGDIPYWEPLMNAPLLRCSGK